MGPYGMNLSVQQLAETEAEADRQLAAARATFPGWRVIETFGGYLAVLAEAEILQSTTVDGLVLKLREH